MKIWSGHRTLSFRLVLCYAKYPPPPPFLLKVKFWSELRTLRFRSVLGWANYPPPTLPTPTQMTCVEGAGMWRLIAVSPTDTV